MSGYNEMEERAQLSENVITLMSPFCNVQPTELRPTSQVLLVN